MLNKLYLRWLSSALIQVTLPFFCLAQFNIRGTIKSDPGNTPVPYASVFLNNTTIATSAANDGSFTLKAIRSGKYDLIITAIGFETYREKISVENADIVLPAIYLKPKTTELEEIVVRASNNNKKYFDQYYGIFKDEFLGKSDIIKEPKILNPGVLNFDYDPAASAITAHSNDFLQIENNELGYKIQYLLNNFTLKETDSTVRDIHYEGSVLFSKIHGTQQQERRWAKKRQELYEGSLMHFLRSVLNDKIEENGFRVLRITFYSNPDRAPDSVINSKINIYTELKGQDLRKYKDSLTLWEKEAKKPKMLKKLIKTPLTREEILQQTERAGIYALVSNNSEFYITYNKRRNFSTPISLSDLDNPLNTKNTILHFNLPYAFFDGNGVILNQNSVTFRGVWGRARVSELLPADYESLQPEVLLGDTILNGTALAFEKYAAAHSNECVYLHLDKPNYGFGDTIWYKAYTVIGQKHQPSVFSGVLYVELISPSDSLVTRQTIPLVSGIGWSDIPLPLNLKPGGYRVRAYTRWMRNFGLETFDEQRVVIGGIAPIAALPPKKCDVQFFPEGGELVDGVRSRVAVKALGSNGLGEDIRGIIEDSSGNLVADFSTQHFGMSVFALVPEAGKTYYARINIEGETAFTADLPKAKPIGYTLSINNNEKDSIYVKIATNDKTLAADKDKTFYIIAQSNGKVYYTTQGKLEGAVYSASIAKNRFPEGIAQFTLFSESGEPIAERVAFIENKADELDLSINSNSQTYNTRDKVSLDLSAKDSTGKPIVGSFSVAVINETEANPDENNESTILNNLLLTSELKGYIERPNYYFINRSDKTRADLDLLMLTQGYRRYEWKQILNLTTSTNLLAGRPVQLYSPERSQELLGTITTPSGKPLPNSKITLAVAKQGIFRDTTADENGRFIFTGLNITDTATVVIKARKANNGSNLKIKPEQLDYPKISPMNYPQELIITDTAKARQLYSSYNQEQKDYQFKKGRILKTVTIKGIKRHQQPIIANSSNLHGGGNADQVIMYDQMGDGPDLASRLLGKINFVTFSSSGAPVNIRSTSKMAIIVDGITLSGDHLNDINADDVYSVEVLRTGFAKAIYGSSLPGDGALVITTKRGVPPVDPASIHPDGLVAINYTGFYKAKAFYVPKYDHPKRGEQLDDLRTTVYWNPNILTDKDGKATMEFYNNDSKGTYRVVVEGIDDDGRLGRAVYRYEVR